MREWSKFRHLVNFCFLFNRNERAKPSPHSIAKEKIAAFPRFRPRSWRGRLPCSKASGRTYNEKATGRFCGHRVELDGNGRVRADDDPARERPDQTHAAAEDRVSRRTHHLPHDDRDTAQ